MTDDKPFGSEKYWTADEIADLLRVSKMSIYRMIKTGELSALRFGRSYRVSQTQLEEFLAKSIIGD